MNRTLTNILISLTLVVLVMLFIVKYRSLTGLENKTPDSESGAGITDQKNNRERPSSTRPKGIPKHDIAESDSLYSKLKANITKDDVIVTGGYRTYNGNIRFSFIQAEEKEYNGKKFVQVKVKNFEISPETANESDLDYLSTENSRIFDHFGILTSEESKKTQKRLAEKDMKVLTAPLISITPGEKGKILIGDERTLKHFQASIKPTILSDGSFDIELEAKQNRNE